MARLSPEEKALLARLLEAEDDDAEEEEAPAEEEHDEFTYQGRRYRYVPEDVEEIREEEAKPEPVKKAPVKKSGAEIPGRKPAARPAKAEVVPELDPEPPPAARRFHT